MPETVIFKAKLSPAAKKNSILGWVLDKDGERLLKASVTAAPENGKANKAFIALISVEWDIPKTCIEIAGGKTDRLKTVRIHKTGFRLPD